MTPAVQRAAARYVTRGDGWIGHCCFSYDEHYDAANTSFGRVVACNEFVLEPGAGFGPHRHAGVEVVTTVLEGELTHVTVEGAEVRGPGSYVLATGDGVEHDERNGGQVPARFVQCWLLPGPGDPRPTQLTLGQEQVALDGQRLVLVVGGEVALDGTALVRGDSARLSGPAHLRGRPSGHALVWAC